MTSYSRPSEAEEARRDANGDPDCPQCRGAGFLRYDVPFGDPNFGQLKTCPCFQRKRAAAQQQRYFANSNLAGLATKTFDAFIGAMKGVGPALQAAQIFAAAPAGWLLLTGTYGCGKTHLALAIANQQLAAGYPVLYQTAPDLLHNLRATFDRDNPVKFDTVFRAAQDAELLILDDLGAEKNSDFAAEKLFGLLDHRYARNLPTVITSNLTIPQLAALNGRIGSRLADANTCRHVHMAGALDYRQLTAAQRAA